MGPRIFKAASAAMQASDSPTVGAFIVGAAAQSAGSFSSSGPGSFPASRRPRSGTIWLAKISAAMPEVKPTVTG